MGLFSSKKFKTAREWDKKGDAFLKQRRYEDAVDCYDQALNIEGYETALLEVEPQNARAWNNRGLALYGLKRYEDAIDCFNLALMIEPELVHSWYNKGLALAGMKRYEEAIYCYDRAIQIEPEGASIWVGKGLALTGLQRYEDAIDCYGRALQIEPKNAMAWNNKGIALYGLKRYEDAIDCYDRALQIDPTLNSARENKKIAQEASWRGLEDEEYEWPEEDEEEGVDYEEDADEDDEYWLFKGWDLTEAGEDEKAIECFERALEISPENDEAWEGKGRALLKLGEDEEALECFEKALEIDDKNDLAWEGKGQVLLLSDEYEKALECFEKAIEINPSLNNAWQGKGKTLMHLNEYEEAIECFDEVLESNSRDVSEGDKIEILVDKVVSLYNLGRHEEAIDILEYLIAIFNKKDWALFYKGMCLLELERYGEAVECFDEITESNKEGDVTGSTLAYCYEYKYDDATHIVCTSCGPYSMKDVWRLKGDTLYSLGKFERAIESYENVLEINPEDRESMKKKKRAEQSLKEMEDKEKKLKKAEKLKEEGNFIKAAEIYRELGELEEEENMERFEKILKKAKGYETALNYKKAAELYEEIELWNDARRCRERIRPTGQKQKIKRHIEIPKEEEMDLIDVGDFFSYTIGKKIGKGGFSKVYTVSDADGNEFAMKIPLDADLKGGETTELSEKILDGFIREARIWNTLTENNIPGIVPLYGFGIHPFPWFVMEYMPNGSLRKKIGEKGMDEKEAVEIAIEVLNTLYYIHHYGIVHRDIKPENVLFDEGNEPKLTDFGLGKALGKASKSSQGFSGTIEYSAPEQLSKRKYGGVDWRTDIYQVGAMLYEMLSGRSPFEGDDLGETTTSILIEEPEPIGGIDEELNDIIQKALAKKKEDRWESAAELKKALLQWK